MHRLPPLSLVWLGPPPWVDHVTPAGWPQLLIAGGAVLLLLLALLAFPTLRCRRRALVAALSLACAAGLLALWARSGDTTDEAWLVAGPVAVAARSAGGGVLVSPVTDLDPAARTGIAWRSLTGRTPRGRHSLDVRVGQTGWTISGRRSPFVLLPHWVWAAAALLPAGVVATRLLRRGRGVGFEVATRPGDGGPPP